MSLAIRDTTTVPPEDWLYHVAATGLTITTKNYETLYPLVIEHCKSNNVAIPSQQEVIDYLCANVHVPCYDSETHVPLINKMGLPFVRPNTGCCGAMPSSIMEESGM
jgi:hypothetical protein